MGFYEQPEEIQVDLLAYHRIATNMDRIESVFLLKPASLNDMAHMALLKNGKGNDSSAPKQTDDEQQRLVKGAIARQCKANGVNTKSVDWWLTPDR